jgi:hypothetical protein
MLTDIQIEDLSKRMNIPLEMVCFKDELPNKLSYNKSYIINLENALDEEGNENQGSHWTALQVNKYPNGTIEPFFFDPYGAPPSESIKKFVLDNTGKKLPYNTKDIQSLMNNACGYYCLALLHYINTWEHRTKEMYDDIACFLEYFDDLNKSIDWKKNEYVLKMFFQSSDPNMRKEIDVIASPDEITRQDTGKGMDMTKIPVSVNIMGKGSK